MNEVRKSHDRAAPSAATGRTSPDPVVRAALKPFVKAYDAIYTQVEELSDRDLYLLHGKIGMFTSTNCDWREYAAIRMIAADVSREVGRRKAKANV